MSEEEMKKYCEKIKNDESIDLDWLIAVKRVEVDSNKNIYNSLFVILICGFFLGIPNYVIRDILLNDRTQGWYFLLWILFVLIGIFYGCKIYKKLLAKDIAKLEVLEYLKKQSATKRTIHFRVENGKLATLKAIKDVKKGNVHGGFSSVDDLIKELDS